MAVRAHGDFEIMSGNEFVLPWKGAIVKVKN